MSLKPYIGLRPFERHETELFFGREQHTDELIDRLGSQHFLAVIGNSGCGKSSLVKTGLIAGLEAGFLATASSYWRIVEMRPGNHPFQALANELFKELKPELSAKYDEETLQQRLRLGSLSLHELLAEQPLANHAQLLIVCDQFEELFRYAGQGAGIEAGNFVSLLLASSQAYPISASQTSHSIYVVITMRSDFLGDCAQFAGLAEAINQGLYLTPRLNTQQLRAAIEEPALVCQGEIEPALISQLLEDAETNPDQLPLLQHVLMRLWDLAANQKPSPEGEGWVTTAGMQEVEQRKEQLPRGNQNHHITLADYEQLGGLNTALSNHADEAFLSLSKRQQKLAQNLFCQLTGHDNEKRDTRRPLTLHQLHRISNKPYLEVVQVLDVFRQSGCGFLLPPISQPLNEETPEQIIDISHESLIRQWQRLKDWVQEEAEHAEKYQRLVAEAQRRQQGQGFRALLAGSELDEAAKWLQDFNPSPLWAERYTSSAADKTTSSLSPWERAGVRENNHASQELSLLTDYIQQSQAAQARAEEEKRLAQQRKIREAQRITGLSITGLLIAAALATWAFTERQHAEATEQHRTEELYQSRLTHASLLAKGEDYAGAKSVLADTYPLDKAIPATQQHQRNLLASFADLQGGAAEQVYEGAGNPLVTVALSPDGDWLAAGGESGTLVVFDAKTGKLVQRLLGHATEGSGQENAVMSLAFTPDGKQLISAGADKKIIVWQQGADQTFSQLAVWQASAGVNAIAISPDGLTVASGGDDNIINLWDLASGKLKTTLKQHSQMIAERGLSFNATGELLASASYDDTAIVWQVASGQPVQQFKGHSADVQTVAFSPDSQTLLTGSMDQTLRLWTIKDGKPLTVLRGHRNSVFAAGFVGNGDTLMSASADRTTRLWDKRSGVTLRLWQGHTSGIGQLASHADQLFSASKDGTLRRWSLALPYQQSLALPSEADSAAITPDLSAVAVGFADGRLALYQPDSGLALWQQALAHTAKIKRLAFNAGGDLLASGSFDKTAKIWRLTKSNTTDTERWALQAEQTLSRHSAAIHAVAFAPDSQTLATASYDGSLGLFPLRAQAAPQFIKAHTGIASSVVFNDSGTQLLSSGIDDFTSKWWDITSQPPRLLSELTKAKDSVLWASLSPDQHWLSTADRGGIVTLTNLQTQQPLALVGHENTVLKSLFTPDSATLASVSGDATVKLWNLAAEGELFSLRLPTNQYPPVPLWDFDFRCLKTCRLAVPLTAGRLLSYQLSYQDRLDFGKDATEQKRTAMVLWQDYLNLSLSLLQQNALPAAQQALREADDIGKPLREHYPDDALIQQAAMLDFTLQAAFQIHLGQIPAALASYQQALSAAEFGVAHSLNKPAAFNALLAIVNAYTGTLSTNQQTDAIPAIQQRLLALPLSEAGLLLTRARWAQPLGYQAAADKDLQQALANIDHQNAEELYLAGYGLAMLKNRYPEAYALLKQAITLKPDDANIRDSLGWVLFKLGKTEAALAHLQAADCKKDQLSKEALAELNDHTHAVLKALGKTKTPPWQCQQVRVQNVIPNSQGETLGIQAGDIFLSYHGKAVMNFAEFIKTREQEQPNAAAKTLVVQRQGKTLSFAIKPGKIGVDLTDMDNLPPLPGL